MAYIVTRKCPVSVLELDSHKGSNETQNSPRHDPLYQHKTRAAWARARAYPLDCSVRITVGDQYEGTGLMIFTPEYAECQTINRRDGRLSQRLELTERVRWLGSHPICGDALCLRIYDLANGPGKQFFPNLMLTSPDHRGATGPMLFRLGFGLEFVGPERISVAAGSFDSLHFRYVDTAGQLPEEHPPYDVWCTNDGNYVFLKGGVGGYMQTYYELIELLRND